MPTQRSAVAVPSDDASPDTWLDVDQASEYLGFSGTSIRRWCRAKRIRHARAPGRNSCYRFRREWLDEFLEERTVNPRGIPYVPKSKRPMAVTETFAERYPTFASAMKKAQARAEKRQQRGAQQGEG